MYALLLWLSGTASAAPTDPGPHLDLSLGYEAVANDPFLRRRGVRVGALFAPIRWVGLDVSAGYAPDLGEADWTGGTEALLALGIQPDLSRVVGQANANLAVFPLSASSGALSTRAGLVAGGGVVYTVDDLDMLYAVGDPEAEATARQLHPAWTLGLTADAAWEHTGFRLRAERRSYTETVLSDVDERKNPLWLGADVLYRW